MKYVLALILFACMSVVGFGAPHQPTKADPKSKPVVAKYKDGHKDVAKKDVAKKDVAKKDVVKKAGKHHRHHGCQGKAHKGHKHHGHHRHHHKHHHKHCMR